MEVTNVVLNEEQTKAASFEETEEVISKWPLIEKSRGIQIQKNLGFRQCSGKYSEVGVRDRKLADRSNTREASTLGEWKDDIKRETMDDTNAGKEHPSYPMTKCRA